MEDKIKAMEEETEAEKQDGSFSAMSQRELEESMAKAREALEAAKAQKAFDTCIELQVRRKSMKIINSRSISSHLVFLPCPVIGAGCAITVINIIKHTYKYTSVQHGRCTCARFGFGFRPRESKYA